MRFTPAVLVGATVGALCSGANAQTSACRAVSSGDGARIEEAGFVTLGGIEQWVTIRGDDTRNPVLLHVHGGPGFAFSAFTAAFAADEADYTVVHWDQRGSGCTFGRYGHATSDVTIERIAQDGIELAQFVRFTPNGGNPAPVDAAYLQGLMASVADVMTPEELTAWQAGRDASVGWLLQQVQGTDLLETVDRLQVPFFVIQGAEDAITPTSAATAFFEHVEAPVKELFVIDGAGHFPHFTHSTEFLAALARTNSLR